MKVRRPEDREAGSLLQQRREEPLERQLCSQSQLWGFFSVQIPVHFTFQSKKSFVYVHMGGSSSTGQKRAADSLELELEEELEVNIKNDGDTDGDPHWSTGLSPPRSK